MDSSHILKRSPTKYKNIIYIKKKKWIKALLPLGGEIISKASKEKSEVKYQLKKSSAKQKSIGDKGSLIKKKLPLFICQFLYACLTFSCVYSRFYVCFYVL